MAKNREMLKEAIAEAKAVKEMAIANAKAALEEAFTPQLKSMLSLKLQEMEKEDLEEENIEEEGFGKTSADPEEGFGAGMDEKALDEEKDEMMEVDLEELLAELELEEGDEVEEGEGENLYEAEEEGEEEGEEEEGEEEEGDMEMGDLSDDEIKDMIEDVIAQMIKDGELEAGPEFEGEEEGEEMEMGAEEEEEEVDLAELLREIEEMEDLDETEEPIDELFGMKPRAVKEFEKDYPGLLAKAKEAGDEKTKISILIDAIKKFREEYIKDTKSVGVADKAVAEVYEFVGVKPATIASFGPEGRGGAKLDETDKMEEELTEALSTIETLKAEINEINLLNAKLLYSNKIFKAKNLNENQKVKVLSSFDKAKNVGEVKMVYETLNEGIKVAKNTIKENLGRASKSTITPTTKQPIVESNDVFARMQKLAGLI
jgi:hypothetical protein